MKNFLSGAILAFLTLSAFTVFAQEPTAPLNNPNYSRPKIFADLPEKMTLRLTDAESLLDKPVGTAVTASLAPGLRFSGTVVSTSDAADTWVKSVVIRTNRQGAIFTFTRIRAKDGSLSYIGRMLNKTGGDALQIVREGKDYVIRKKGIYDMLNE